MFGWASLTGTTFGPTISSLFWKLIFIHHWRWIVEAWNTYHHVTSNMTLCRLRRFIADLPQKSSMGFWGYTVYTDLALAYFAAYLKTFIVNLFFWGSVLYNLFLVLKVGSFLLGWSCPVTIPRRFQLASSSWKAEVFMILLNFIVFFILFSSQLCTRQDRLESYILGKMFIKYSTH